MTTEREEVVRRPTVALVGCPCNEVIEPSAAAMQQDGNDGVTHPEATRDEYLRRWRHEMDRIKKLVQTLEAQVAGNDASLTVGDLSVVVGHVSRDGGCLKEAADYLSNIHNTNSLQGGVAEGGGSGRADDLAVEKTQKTSHASSISVAGVSDSKRARVEDRSGRCHVAAAAAAAGGSDDVDVLSPQQDDQGHDQELQHANVVGHVLCLLNKGINSIADYTANHHPSSAQDGSSKASPFGIYRNLTIAKEEVAMWSNLDLATKKRLKGKLGNVTTARIPASAGPCKDYNSRRRSFIATCLAKAKASLKHLYIDRGFGNFNFSRRSPLRASPPVAFTALTNLHVECDEWIGYFGEAMWTFPALKDCRGLRVALGALGGLTHIMSSSPQLMTLTGNISCFGSHLIAALGQCSRLTTIRGLAVDKCALRDGHLAELQRSLDPHWSKPDMQGVVKTIELVYECPVGHNLGDLTRPLPDFLAWARQVGATVEWRLNRGNSMTVDCSKEPSTVFPAVRGPVADVVNQLAKQAERVWLWCGGTPLDESWKDVLNFPNVRQLHIIQWMDDIDEQSVQSVSDSIPPFMTAVDEAGNNVCFPAVEHLESRLAYLFHFSQPPEGAWHFPAGPNKLGTLLGSLRHVRSVEFSTSDLWVFSECLPLLPTERLDKLRLDFGHHVRALPDTYPPHTRPAVASLSFDGIDGIGLSKDEALLVTSVVTHVRPSKAHLSLPLDPSECQLGEEGASDEEQIAHAEKELRALACECFERVMASYSLESLTVQCQVEEEGEEEEESFLGSCVLTLDLVAKGQ
ncbi:unnamed protein product [Vitrella brassicaformis CCMP3155]|uniref:Uncharacterized protein n=1 Tax=Vitrella brassicaformis (strain CCMP3155) TaxID=1169540 RepID=A0A0G4GYF0_VITBC|nr:unnamed protein product [Vitrella brassicaformis CCMP3155]|eukprot:CEM36174.1 unnamed protein product [Vitrella brassicaformis CCMP3155]